MTYRGSKAEIPKFSFMKTIIKFPIYVAIETDNVDRKIVSDAANQIFYPHLLQYLSSAKYRSSVLEEFRRATKVTNLDVTLLTELDMLRKMTGRDE